MDEADFEHKEYLGDGLYAGFDGFHVVLWTDRLADERNPDGPMVRHYVCLDSHVLGSLWEYLEGLPRPGESREDWVKRMDA